MNYRKIVWTVNKNLNRIFKTSLFDELYWKFRPDFNGDWGEGGYWESQSHPHREEILSILRKNTKDGYISLTEIGCHCGPNLELIQRSFPATYLSGTDISKKAIEEGKRLNPYVNLITAPADKSPFANDSYDYVLADAVLMYLGPDKIRKVVEEMIRVAKKMIIIVDFHDENLSASGEVAGGHWVRDYKKLFAEYGLKTEVRKITEKEWPGSYTWKKLGYLITVDLDN